MSKKVTIVLVASLFTLSVSSENKKGIEYKYNYLYTNLPFDMPKVPVPVFPDRQVSITDFGGVGDGITLNTKAFADAMDALAKEGGGTLDVPIGVWFTGPIVFQSNINFHLEKGALVLFTPDSDAYPLIKTWYEGAETHRCQSPISGKNLVNIAITGEGSINGSGQAWRPLKKGKVIESHWKNTVKSGGILLAKDLWEPFEKASSVRPVMISFIECKNILLQGVLFENSPAWNIHPLMCENIIIDNVFIRNPVYAQNGDGLDLESCKNAIIVNSLLDVGDDAICIKSGKDEEGRKRGIPTENVIVDNCKVFKGHGGFVVGSEMSGGVKNIFVKNSQFIGTDVGLRFKSLRGRGGIVENIYIEGITMIDIETDSFLFDLYYGGKSVSEALADGDEEMIGIPEYVPVTEATPVFRNIYVKNIISKNDRRAMFFNGLPEMNITNINVENSEFSSLLGAELSESDGVKFKNVKIVQQKGERLILNNVKNFEEK